MTTVGGSAEADDVRARARAGGSSRLERFKRQQWLLGAAATLIVLIAWWGGTLDPLEGPTLDWRTRLFCANAAGPSPEIVVMAIDDRAIAEVGAWPWRRGVMAEAVNELRAAGAKTIALDVMFTTASADDPQGDAALAEAIGRHGNVVLPLRFEGIEEAAAGRAERGVSVREMLRDEGIRKVLEGEADRTDARTIAERLAELRKKEGGEAPEIADVEALVPAARAIAALEARSSLPEGAASARVPETRARGAVPPLPSISAAASAVGDVTIERGMATDAGTYRRMALWTNFGGRLWPSFSLAAVATHLDRAVSEVQLEGGTQIEIPGSPARRIRTSVVKVDGEARPFVHVITWPRGGREWRGQFTDARAKEGDPPREVSLLAALEPHLHRRALEENLRTLERLLHLAGELHLKEFTAALERVRALRGTPMQSEAWLPNLEALASAAMEAAEESRDFLEFAGDVDPATLNAADRRTHFGNRDVAEKIPEILAECRATPERINAARLRLRGIAARKLVFVGWTAVGSVTDVVDTSLRAQTPGVYIHAAAASSHLTGFARRPAPALVDAVLVALMGVGGIAAGRRPSVWAAVGLAVGVVLGWFLFAGVILWDFGWVIASVAAPTLAASASWLVVLLHRLLVEQRLRRRTEERFRSYVSPAVVDELVNNPELDSMTPQRRELTIMFCDVAGFTAMAERLGAEGTARFLSGYLGRMTDTLLRHGATIDKYLGDGIMAFWGAPIQDARHARNACRAAASLVRAVAEFDGSAGAGEGPLRIRIGMAAGEVMVGDFGNPPIRSSYTALGDACNIAARLERACKALGTAILASSSVHAEAGDGFLWRPLGRFILHGRRAPEPVFELVGWITPGGGAAAGELALALGPGRRVGPESVTAWLQATEEALGAVARGDWNEARERFAALAREYGDELLAKVYIEAIEAHVAGGAGTPLEAVALGEA